MNFDHSILEAITQVSVSADLGRLARLMYMPGPEAFDEQLLKQLDDVRHWCAKHVEPQYGASRLAIASIRSERICTTSGAEFRTGRFFSEQLRRSKATDVIVVGLTLGSGLSTHAKRLWNEGRVDVSYLLSTYGAALTETFAAKIGLQLCQWASELGRGLLPQQGPGYNDWPTEYLTDLHELLMKGSYSTLHEFGVSPVGALLPTHSLLVVYGLTRESQILGGLTAAHNPCHTCRLPSCDFRRTASDMDSQLPLLEQIA